LGLLVWQDMPSGFNATQRARAQFEREIKANLTQLHNHPSIVSWVLFNERWGAYDQERIARWMKQLDPSRLLNAHSGPNGNIAQWMRHANPAILARVIDTEMNIGDYKPITDALRRGIYAEPSEWIGGDLYDTHQYPYPELPVEFGKPRILGEFGGIGGYVAGHVWSDVSPGFSYLPVPIEQTATAYADLIEQQKALKSRGLSGSFYTQLFDVEQEQNGLMTYDRAIARIPVAEVAKHNRRLVPFASDEAAASEELSLSDAGSTPENERYTQLVSRFRAGEREPEFLRDLTITALLQKNQARATEFGNELIARLPMPYSKESWAFINATTRTLKDRGFELFRTHTEQVNATLGPQTAEKASRRIIKREHIEPLLVVIDNAPDWRSLETRLRAQYGAIGAEALHGAAMIDSADRGDWKRFGEYCVRYFETAAARSEYFINNVSYAVFEHVDDLAVVRAVISAIERTTNLDKIFDAFFLDTYAGLLYKAGRREQALRWQHKAVAINDGQDAELTSNLEKMKAGRPTWPQKVSGNG
jgi:hypothetical protein